MSTDVDGPSGPSMDRRMFMKTVGATAGLAAVGAGAQTGVIESPIGEAKAIPPVVIAAGATATGWLLRDHEVLGQDDPPEGLTADALEQRVYETARTRESTNASTFIDNQNIIDGAEHAGWADAKIAAIEALNDEDSQSDVIAAGNDGAADYFTTIKENFLKSWNETANELANLVNAAQDHPDVTAPSIFHYHDGTGWNDKWNGLESEEHTLPDGSTIDVRRVHFVAPDGDGAHYWDATGIGQNNISSADINSAVLVNGPGGDQADPVRAEEWNSVWTAIEDAQTAVEDGIGTWVEGVYGDVQAGDLDTSDLLTPRELAELTSDEEDFNQAVADLQALNVSTDLNREATIEMNDGAITLDGTIQWTESGTLETGTYDPASESGDFYLTYDISQGGGVWESYDDAKGVDGGEIDFTSEPHAETTFTIHTGAGEEVEVVKDDFQAYDSNDNTVDPAIEDASYWRVDVTGDLDDAVTSIDQVTFAADVDETQYETVQLQDSFEITEFTDTESGETTDSAEFEREEPQDDTNYISEEEWQDMQDDQQELIDKYEEETSGGGGGLFPGGGLFDWSPFGTIETIILIGLGLFGASTLSN